MSKSESKKYELMLILKSSLSDTQRKSSLSKIASLITENGGSIENESAWGKRLLSFPINHQKEGYYILYNILLPSNSAEPIKLALNINGDVLRYILKKTENFESVESSVETTKINKSQKR